MRMEETQALIPSVSIEAVIERRNAMIERIQSAHKALSEMDSLAENMFGENRGYRLTLTTYQRRHQFTTAEGLNDLVKEIDGRAWAFLLHESGLQSFLDAEARKQWEDAIEKNDTPELTLENIAATFSTLYAARGVMFERGVIEVFRKLSWSYKTNCPVMFSKRVVLTYIVERYGMVSSRGCDKLDDLVRVFSLLDGKPEPDHREGMYRKLNEAKRSIGSGELIDLPYFTIRLFKNVNGHLVFKRTDLVDKMNAILAKHYPGALAASREAA